MQAGRLHVQDSNPRTMCKFRISCLRLIAVDKRRRASERRCGGRGRPPAWFPRAYGKLTGTCASPGSAAAGARAVVQSLGGAHVAWE